LLALPQDVAVPVIAISGDLKRFERSQARRTNRALEVLAFFERVVQIAVDGQGQPRLPREQSSFRLCGQLVCSSFR